VWARWGGRAGVAEFAGEWHATIAQCTPARLPVECGASRLTGRRADGCDATGEWVSATEEETTGTRRAQSHTLKAVNLSVTQCWFGFWVGGAIGGRPCSLLGDNMRNEMCNDFLAEWRDYAHMWLYACAKRRNRAHRISRAGVPGRAGCIASNFVACPGGRRVCAYSTR